MQRFARVPVHAAVILKSAEAAIILERIREVTVGDLGKGQHSEYSAKYWEWSVPWMSVRQIQEHVKKLVDGGYVIRTQLYNEKGHRAQSLYAVTAKALEILSIQKASDYIGVGIQEMHDAEVDTYLTRKTALGGEPNAETLTRKTAHRIETYKIDIQQHPPRAPHAAPKGAVGVEEAYASESQPPAGGGLPLGERTWVEAVAESQQKGKADKAAQAKASRDKDVAEIYDYLVTRWPKKAGDQQGAAALTAIKGVVRRGATLERLRRRFLEAVAAWETWDAVPPPNIAKWLAFDAWDQPVRARRPPPPPPTVQPRRRVGTGPITYTDVTADYLG